MYMYTWIRLEQLIYFNEGVEFPRIQDEEWLWGICKIDQHHMLSGGDNLMELSISISSTSQDHLERWYLLLLSRPSTNWNTILINQ